MAKVNTADIAEKLGLSRNTVSKALNDRPEVAEKTKKLVIETAVQMGYKGLGKQNFQKTKENSRNKDICLLLPECEINNNYWSRILKGVEEYLTAHKYRIVLAIVTEEDAESLRLPLTLQNNTVSGIITIGIFSKEYYEKLGNNSIPVVTIDTAADIKSNNLLNDTIMISNHGAVYDITEHMIKNGYREIAFAGAPDSCRSIRERWNGFRDAMRDNSVDILEKYNVFQKIDGHEEKDIGTYFEEVIPLPEALVCANDNVAHKMIELLEKRGIQVPEDMAVSGFDDFDDDRFQKVNELTSVTYNIAELGNLAARQILYRIKYPEASCMMIRLASTVVFRASTEFKKNVTE